MQLTLLLSLLFFLLSGSDDERVYRCIRIPDLFLVSRCDYGLPPLPPFSLDAVAFAAVLMDPRTEAAVLAFRSVSTASWASSWYVPAFPWTYPPETNRSNASDPEFALEMTPIASAPEGRGVCPQWGSHFPAFEYFTVGLLL